MTSENWDKPPLWQLARDPALLAEWKAKTAAWAKANPETAKAMDEAYLEDDARTKRQAAADARLLDLRFGGVPERIVEAYSKGLQGTRAVEAVRTFMASDKCFLLLLGSPGCGKSVAAGSSLAGESGTFRRAVELSRLSAYDKDDRRTWDFAMGARVLVVDDLGAEMLHDAWRPLLDELIDIRYGAQRKTIITSNLDKDGFKARYGERIADRIRHDGFVETCGNKSMRSPDPTP